MQTFLYDGSWPGVLCALFAALHALREAPEGPRPRIAAGVEGGNAPAGLFEDAVPVATDEALAERVREGLRRRGTPRTPERLYRAFLSEADGVEDVLLAYVEALRDGGRAVEEDVLVPPVGAVDRLARMVGREVHRMHAFVRFEAHEAGARDGASSEASVWRAVVEPVCDVLPLLGDHFTARYPAQRWLILDARRRRMLYWDRRDLRLLSAPALAEDAAPLRPAPEEALYQRLWQAYFTAVDIPARRNPTLQQRHLPLRYRKHLTELRPCW